MEPEPGLLQDHRHAVDVWREWLCLVQLLGHYRVWLAHVSLAEVDRRRNYLVRHLRRDRLDTDSQ
jgi:hypothetical protein